MRQYVIYIMTEYTYNSIEGFVPPGEGGAM